MSIFNPPLDAARWLRRIEAGLPVYVGVHMPKNTVATLNGDCIMVDSHVTLARLVRYLNRAARRGWQRTNGGYRCACGKIRNTLRSLMRHRKQKHGLRNPQ